jgi:hypothetical protein
MRFCRQMPYTGHTRLPQRPSSSPFGKDCVDRRIVKSRFSMGVCRHRQALPLHPRIEDPQDEIEGPVIAQLARWPPPGHREVRQEKCGDLAVGQLYRDRGRCRLCGGCTHQGRASCVAWQDALKIALLHPLQEGSGICKTRNQLHEIRLAQSILVSLGASLKALTFSQDRLQGAHASVAAKSRTTSVASETSSTC